MWIVRLALRRPYTVAVFAALIFLMGCLAISSMMVDIFPVIDIPVVVVVWSYNGLSALEMEERVVFISERALSTTVSGISRIESESIPGVGLLRVYFEPGSDIGGAIAQINAVTSTIVRILPPGMTPPNVVRFNASNVPVAQMTMSSSTLSEEQIFDYALNFIRVSLFTIPGLSTPAPYGGRQRQVNVNVDPRGLYARGLSPADVVTALTNQSLILPAGVARIGPREINVATNASPTSPAQFAKIPVRVGGRGQTVTIGDVARVADAYADQTNIVRINGKRAAYLSILKKANASTLEVVDRARKAIPDILKVAPRGLDLRLDFDQSVFVKGAVISVLREAGVASALVSVMILLFLGSWRSVVIVCTSIPLAILCSLVGLKLTGNSINVMTLGGLSLAIGMLVDDATVEVENIHRNLAAGTGKTLTAAILQGAQQIALPAITATLAICIVFFPVVLLTGPARFLFTPMAEAVVFAMLASYVLSRTLVPLLARLLMKPETEVHQHDDRAPSGAASPPVPSGRRRLAALNLWREGLFARLQRVYGTMLEATLRRPGMTIGFFGFLVVSASLLSFLIGLDFFPPTDAGIMKFHFRAPSGSRLEETERYVAAVEERIREIVPAAELETITADIGVPTNYNLAFVPTANTAPMDAEVLVSLKPGHGPTAAYIGRLRRALIAAFPECTVNFQPADIVSQVLNFGLTSPIDVQVQDRNLAEGFALARRLKPKIEQIPGAADVVIRQVDDYPQVRLNVDRVNAAGLGLTVKDVATSMLISLSSSAQTSPNYFINPVNSVNYQVAVKVPLSDFASLRDLTALPVTGGAPSAGTLGGPASVPASGVPGATQTLANVAMMATETTMNEVSHATVQRTVDIDASPEGRDLGGVVRDIERAIAALGPLPAAAKIKVAGQSEVMYESFTKLGLGLLLAVLLVYLLMAVLFQSWIDPLLVVVAIPGALVGILWMLLLTGTTINVTSLMGAIMAVGIASSNSILLVTFANDLRVDQGLDSRAAALLAGKTRLRPVLMTAIAMILGMLPAALGLGEGGAQNAPLGRAVIGGLLVATAVTLLVVPVAYAALRKEVPLKHMLDARLRAEAEGRPFDPAHVLPGRLPVGTP